MTPLARKLIDQFNTALGRVSSAEQLNVQRQVADLLLRSKTQYSERQKIYPSTRKLSLMQKTLCVLAKKNS